MLNSQCGVRGKKNVLISFACRRQIEVIDDKKWH